MGNLICYETRTYRVRVQSITKEIFCLSLRPYFNFKYGNIAGKLLLQLPEPCPVAITTITQNDALPAYMLIFLLCILLSITLAYGVVGLGLEPPA